MPSTIVKRSKIKHYVNSGPFATPTFKLLNDGISEAKINYAPETSSETYIADENATVEVEGYKGTLPLKGIMKKGDPAFDFFDTMRIAGPATLDDAHADIVNMWGYKDPTSGNYPAERRYVSVQFDDVGGPGGKAAEFNLTINFRGDPILGVFNPSTLTFTPNP